MQRFRGSSRGGRRFSGIGTGMRNRVDSFDRTNLALIAAGATLILAIIFPRVYPASRRGIACSDLAAPLGGNNRSMLALSGDDRQNLDLELEIENDPVAPGEALRVNVRFVNNDIGPIILYLDRQQPPLSSNAGVIGLRFEIRNLNNNVALEGAAPTTPAGWPNVHVDSDLLHLLGSRARCNETIPISITQLQPGDYRIQAFYFNNNSGIWQSNFTARDQASPTQAYSDQGVWTGDISSSEVRFTVRSPGP